MNQDPRFEELRGQLIKDLQAVGVNTSIFDLYVKEYSKTYFGVYRPQTNRIYVFALTDDGKQYPYPFLFSTALHEAVHAIQYHDPRYVRYSGVMHDEEFYTIYDRFAAKAEKLMEKREYIRQKAMGLDKAHRVSPVEYIHTCFNSVRPCAVLRPACKRRPH